MRVHNNRLWIGIANHAYALMPHKVVKLILKARTEIIALQTVDRTVEATLLVERHEACTLSA